MDGLQLSIPFFIYSAFPNDWRLLILFFTLIFKTSLSLITLFGFLSQQ